MTIEFNGTANMTRSRVFRRGYYAAVSYTDFNIGRMLASLKGLGFEDNTVVIVFGDHVMLGSCADFLVLPVRMLPSVRSSFTFPCLCAAC